MKLDRIWKFPFQDPKTNKVIAQLSYETISQVIKTGQDFNLFYDNSLDKFKDFSDFHEHSDLSSINKITKFNCNNIFNQQTISSLKNKISEDSMVFYFIKNPRLTNIYSICKNLAQIDKLPDNIVAKLFYKDQRYSEINQIISFLILYRNYSAHSTNERNDLGLCLSVGSKLLRFTELLELERSRIEAIQDLRELSIKIIKDTFEHDPTDEINAKVIYEEKNDTNALMLEISNNINFIKDSIVNQKKSGLENDIFDTEQLTHETLESKSDDYDLYQDSNLTITQLKQKLLELRKVISKEFKLKDDDQNILSKENIEGIILLGVSNEKEWRKINSVNKSYSKHKKLMDKQIDKHWLVIQDLLLSIDWLEN